jgi:hypothetical protein
MYICNNHMDDAIEEDNIQSQTVEDDCDLSPEQLELIQKRQASYKAYPENILTWDDIKSRLRK